MKGKAAPRGTPASMPATVRSAVPEWTAGRFGAALRFDGVDDCVFRQLTPTIEGLRQLTVECWFQQERSDGRQFLLGKDVTFHFDFSDGSGTSLSLYNRGGVVANADGLPHQQLGLGLGPVRYGRWHHLAATFDGQQVSFFLDGVLRGRQAGARDFLLGAESRGLWIGCYVGQDFWFSGKIDEVRVSDCVRYDPEQPIADRASGLRGSRIDPADANRPDSAGHRQSAASTDTAEALRPERVRVRFTESAW